MTLQEALQQRRSIRAFRPDPVPPDLIREILADASRAPSGTNIQPWKVHVVSGEVRRRLEAEVMAHRETDPHDKVSEFPRTGGQRRDPYLGRMRTLGKAMYGLLEIPKGDQEANWRQWGRNYQFFGAPVGLIFTLDRDLDAMSFLDVGAFMQTFMLSAATRGLGTCAQGAWNNFWSVTRQVLEISEDEIIVAGMSLGWPDESAPVNSLVADREPIDSFAVFHGF